MQQRRKERAQAVRGIGADRGRQPRLVFELDQVQAGHRGAGYLTGEGDILGTVNDPSPQSGSTEPGASVEPHGDAVHGSFDESRLFAGRAWPLAGRLVLLLAVLVSAASPILVYDTDLWYHLRHARQLAETGQLVDSTDFSYLPERPFTNYYWLFQILILGVFQVTGFGGLIVLRTAVWSLALWGVDRLMRPASGGALAALVPGLVAMVMLDRALNLRPHLLSYTCLVLLLLAFERRRAPWWAVAVGLVWSNVHGVAFPVLWAIAGAYGAETLFETYRETRFRSKPSPEVLRRLTVLTATGLSMLATPHGLRLLTVPFRSTADASRIIEELLPFDPSTLLRVDLMPFDGPSAFTLLAWLTLGLASAAAMARPSLSLRLSRPLLIAAGLILVAKADRLQVELALLSLPLLCDLLAARSESTAAESGHGVRARGLVLVVSAALMLVLTLSLLTRAREALVLPHPLFDGAQVEQPARLPQGAAVWLIEHGPGGRLMQQADHGGYWMWTLGSRYQIHMDLELPFAFSALDYFELQHALFDAAALETMLRRYGPDFIALDARPAGFGERLRAVAPHYVPVFVDDAVTLWMDGRKHPALASRWQIRSFDVERALADPAYRVPVEARSELLRLRDVADDVRLPHRLLAQVSLTSGDAKAALEHAEALRRLAPERAESHLAEGDALMANRLVPAARAAFERALELAAEPDRRAIHRRLAYVELELERPGDAYRHLRRVVDVDVMRASPRDLELLARLAEQLGEAEHAAQLRAVLQLRQPR